MSQTILITGASSGIGKATARLFAAQGWNVAATMRQPDQENELTDVAGVRLYALDVTQTAGIRTTVDQVLRDFSGVDVLLNNAGYGLFGPLETVSAEKLMDQFQTNLFGAIHMIQGVLPAMREQKRGTIINVTSIGGLVGLPFNSIYHATKFGLDGLSESLNYELRPFGVRVKIVAPGGVATDFATRSLQQTTDGPSVYDADIKKVMAAFQQSGGAYSSADQIAEVIYRAATDDADQLRYLAGTDAQGLYATWKEMTNEAFFTMIQERYGLA